MTTSDIHLQRVLEAADPAVRFQDDLFRAVNGTWLDTYEIPADLSSDGSFMALHIQAEQQVREIIEEISAKNPTEGEAQKVAGFFNSWMNTEAVNEKGYRTAGG